MSRLAALALSTAMILAPVAAGAQDGTSGTQGTGQQTGAGGTGAGTGTTTTTTGGAAGTQGAISAALGNLAVPAAVGAVAVVGAVLAATAGGEDSDGGPVTSTTPSTGPATTN